MYEYIILGITFAFAAAVQPGPLQTYIISQAILKGWRRTLPAAFAPVLSDAPIILFVLLILGNLPGVFLNILQIVGGFFLLYLAYNSYKSWKYFTEEEDKVVSKNQTLFKAVVVNLLNPNPYLGWSLVMGPLLLKGWNENPTNGIVLVVSFYVTIIISLAITIILASFATQKLGEGSSKVLIGISAIALACFGLYSLLIGIKDLLIYQQ